MLNYSCPLLDSFITMAAPTPENKGISFPAPVVFAAAIVALAFVIAPMYDRNQRLQTQLDTSYQMIDKLRGFNGGR